MFLMNAPPVVTLRSRWEAFGPPGSFRFPGCFSEPKEDPARASVSARVQMIISTLQRDEAALGMKDERATQRGPRVERCRDARPAASPAVRKEQPTFAACAVAADGRPLGIEAAAGCGPGGLDSDSDDSVDRDIEEAIQEYLRAKSGASRLISREVRPSPPEPSHSSPAPTLCPPKLAPGSGGGLGSSGGASEDQGSASPASVSSEDSFEQSIRAEIEQFLSEKRQHENPGCDEPVDKTPDPSENPGRFRSNREPSARAPPAPHPMGACKESALRRPPRAAKVSAQPRSLRPKVTEEPENVGSARPAAPKPEAAQNWGGGRRSAGVSRRSKRMRSAALALEASDSSSDGIEEAIQLYQLEKTRKEGGGDPPRRASLGEERGASPPASSSGSAAQSSPHEAHKRAPSKKKPGAPKPPDLTPGGSEPDQASRVPKDTKASAPPAHAPASSEYVDRASCRVDTSAELMCAEAILDISKAILPAPEDGGGAPSAGPLLHAPAVPTHEDGDSSSVDSDDSIEQEIRTFLALKAQAGSPQPAQGPLPPPGSSSQTGVPKAPSLCKAQDLPLSCKRKWRGGGGHAVRPSTPKKTKELREGTQHGDPGRAKAPPGHDGQDPPGQGKASEAPGGGVGEARVQPPPSRTVGLGDLPVCPGHEGHGKAEGGRGAGEKDSSEDKSSSLDSDEDLDTAIKDLLRSKRKLKKRGRDARATGKKKVRFSTTETRFVDRLGGLPRAWKDRSPRVLRSCLSKSRRDGRDGAGKGPPGFFGTVRQHVQPGGAGSEDAGPARPRSRSAEGALFSKDTGACPLPPSTPSLHSLSEDSSVDSDDSIELEIRKFLAEKAKESVSGSEIQEGGFPAPGPGAPSKPEVLSRKEPAPVPQPGVCTRSQRARGAPQPVEGGRGTASLFVQSTKGAPRAEHAARLPAVQGRGEPALPRNTSGMVSAKGSPVGRRGAHVHREQSPSGAEPAPAEGAFGQPPSYTKVGAEAGVTRGPFHGNCGSQSLLTPSPGAQAHLARPWGGFTQHSRLPSPWPVNSEGPGLAWTGGLGGKREKGSEGQTRGPSSLAANPRKAIPFPGFSPLLSTQLFHFGKGVPWGAKQAGLFSPHAGLPLQGPAFSAFREAQASHSPVFGSTRLLAKKDSGHWPNRRVQGALGINDRGSGPEENILDLRYRRRAINRDSQDQEALGSDASEFSDTSMEDSSSSVAKGRVLHL